MLGGYGGLERTDFHSFSIVSMLGGFGGPDRTDF